MAGETSKQRRSRVELEYYRRPSARVRLRTWAGLIALGLAVGWAALAPSWGGGSEVELFDWKGLGNPGKLAASHAIWEQRCEVCHEPWRSIRWDGSSLESGVADENCKACHAGAVHHPDQKESGPACAACHHDHQGRTADLATSDDRLCVECHQGLDGHRREGAGPPGIATSVGGFTGKAESHPEFRAVVDREAGDKGRLIFNHRRHLEAGMPLTGEGTAAGGAVLTYGQLPEADRRRYGWREGMGLETPVQLDCKACHQTDNSDVANWLGMPTGSLAELPTPRGEGGALMMPVRYEAHCKACHPLNFDAQKPELQAPHGVGPGEVLSRLGQYYAEDATRQRPELLDRPVPRSPIPGDPAGDRDEIVSDAVADEVMAAARMLFEPLGGGTAKPKGCYLCHRLSGEASSLSGPGGLAELAEKQVEPTAIPSIWFTKARFDHTSHRAIECAGCHAGVEKSVATAEVLLPGKESCLACHNSDRGAGANAGGACTTCHGYHDMANPWHGRGSSAGAAKAERTVEALLGPARGAGR